MPAPLNLSQARVIDPVLTNVAQGYTNAEFVGSRLFPRVPVMQRGGQVIEFGNEGFQRYASRRAPGGAAARVEFGYQGKPFALVQDKLEGKVPIEHQEDAQRVPGIDLGQRAVNTVMRAITLSLEIDQAALATNAGNYAPGHSVTLAGPAKWSASGTPLTDVETGKQVIRKSCGVKPNLCLMSPDAFNAARNNPSILNRFIYNGQVAPDATQITPQMLAGLFGVSEVVVGEGIYWDPVGGAIDIWGNAVVLAYVPTSLGTLTSEMPSYGYTYTLGGNPLVEQPYFERGCDSWIYPVKYDRVPVLSGIAAGYLIANPA